MFMFMFDYVFECFDGGDWDDFSDIWLELLSRNHYHVVCFEELPKEEPC